MQTWRDHEYWCARANRAIATRLLRTHAVLKSERDALVLTRQALVLSGDLLRLIKPSQTREGWLGLGVRLGEYFRSHRCLLDRIELLGEELDQHVAGSVK